MPESDRGVQLIEHFEAIPQEIWLAYEKWQNDDERISVHSSGKDVARVKRVLEVQHLEPFSRENVWAGVLDARAQGLLHRDTSS